MRTAVLVLAATLAAGCGGDAGQITVPAGHDTARELREVTAGIRHPVYYAGVRAVGLPLTAVEAHPERDEVWFSYGTCTIPLPADGGCAVRLSIQLVPFRAEQWPRGSGCSSVGRIRGVPAVHHGALALITEHGVIRIYAASPARARHAAALLRPVGQEAADGPLPPPPASWARLVDAAC